MWGRSWGVGDWGVGRGLVGEGLGWVDGPESRFVESKVWPPVFVIQVSSLRRYRLHVCLEP